MMETYLQSLNRGLHEAMEADPRVHLLGEDIMDPYGGAFKVERGLSTRFASRVHTTPISEAGFTGLATGMAIRGLRPVVSIMFGDFLTLIFDQVLNHMVKFGTMYGTPIDVPVVIRTPMGGRRGYGATHSQSIEKHFLGVPGLSVWAPSHLHDAGSILRDLILTTSGPALFLENKTLYSSAPAKEPGAVVVEFCQRDRSVVIARNFSRGVPDITIVSYGGLSAVLVPMLEEYAREEIKISLVLPSRIAPFNADCVVDEAIASGLVLIAEEGTEGFSWGNEVAAQLNEKCFGRLKAPIKRLASKPSVIPCSKVGEDDVLVDKGDIEEALMELLA